MTITKTTLTITLFHLLWLGLWSQIAYAPTQAQEPQTAYGTITYNGEPVPNMEVGLQFYDGSDWLQDAVITTTTDMNGYYEFNNLPQLAETEARAITWYNFTYDKRYLWSWVCNEITANTASLQDSYKCSFDIADINLLSPLHNTTVFLPVIFTWEKRDNPTESYELYIVNNDGFFAWRTEPLGYTDNYILKDLPSKLVFDQQYTWSVGINNNNGYGIRIYHNTVSFYESPQPFTSCEIVTSIPQLECEALVALYNNTNGESWFKNNGWVVWDNPCNWYGVDCKTGQVSRLDLQRNNLIGKIPPEIGNLTQLELLIMYGNQLTTLPSEIENLSKLSSLNLYDNNLRELPSELWNLTQLRKLNIGNNNLTQLPSELWSFTQLTSLGLSNYQLPELPPELWDFTQLIFLDLRSNNLTELSFKIGNLTQLTELHLADNQLTKLPSEIGNLTQLTELYLADNPLTELPPELWALTQLEWFDLSGHQLTELSFEIGNLTQLIYLDLSNNQLRGLPPEIGNLTQLIYLGLSNNQLRELPPEVNNFMDLEVLVLSANNLTELPPEIGNLNVGQLLLLNNNLTELPPEIGNLTQLWQLDLTNNNLTILPSEINKLTLLRQLHLSNNNLIELPPELWNLTQLGWLYLSNNQLTTLPSEIGNLTKLEWLYLSNNQLTTLPSEIGNLTKLEWLYLSNNQLTTLPSEIGNLKELRRFYLSNNNLQGQLLPNIQQLSQLNTLWFQENEDFCVPNDDKTLLLWLYRIEDMQRSALCTIDEDGGDGRFGENNAILGTKDTQALAVDDLNNDNYLDVFVADANASVNTIWWNDQQGNLYDSGQSLGEWDSYDVELRDVDDDDTIDAIVANGNSHPNKVWVNGEAGDFRDSGQLLGQSNHQVVALSDDYLVFGGPDGTTMWKNFGGKFTQQSQAFNQISSVDLLLVDVELDGDTDLLILNEAGLTIWFNDGDDNFTQETVLPFIDGQAVDQADFDNDSQRDLFIGRGNNQPDLIWWGNGDGTFTAGPELGYNDTKAVLVGYLNQDEYKDMVSVGTGNDSVWLNNGNRTFSPSNQTVDFGDTKAIALADMDNDTYPDIVIGGSQVQDGRIWRNVARLPEDETEIYLPHIIRR